MLDEHLPLILYLEYVLSSILNLATFTVTVLWLWVPHSNDIKEWNSETSPRYCLLDREHESRLSFIYYKEPLLFNFAFVNVGKLSGYLVNWVWVLPTKFYNTPVPRATSLKAWRDLIPLNNRAAHHFPWIIGETWDAKEISWYLKFTKAFLWKYV